MVKHVVISIPSPWRILRVFASQTLLQLHVVFCSHLHHCSSKPVHRCYTNSASCPLRSSLCQEVLNYTSVSGGNIRLACIRGYLYSCSKDFCPTQPLAGHVQGLRHWARHGHHSESSLTYWSILLPVSPYIVSDHFQSLIHADICSPILCFHGVVLWLETSPDLEHSISYQYSALLIVAGLIVMNSLACRVFRLLRQLKTGGRQPTRFRDMVSTMRFRQTTQMELDTREVNMRGPMEMETIH